MRQGGSNSKGSSQRCFASAEFFQRLMLVRLEAANADPVAGSMKCKAKWMAGPQRWRG
jgi:hypothetical protein